MVPSPPPGEGVVPLRRWLWQSYLRSALIPLLVIELTFLGIYWASTAIVYRENVTAVRAVSGDYLNDVARREAASIGNLLGGVAVSTTLFARQTKAALEGNYMPPESERRRYAMTSDGRFYTLYDNGTTASYYTGHVRAGEAERQKVWRLSALDPLMMDIKNSDPKIASLYFNTYDSYNRIYPYIEVLGQFPGDIDVTQFNFYYEADAARNPARRQVWTDAYVDPAGHGWMVSSIAPVWSEQRLEGVVGIDVTLNTIIDKLLALRLPWSGYAMLVDRDGEIIALPPLGEQDFKLREVTAPGQTNSVPGQASKPDAFNIFHRPDTRDLARAMASAKEGQVELTFDGPHLASFATVPGTGWKLVVIAPESRIFANAESLRVDTEQVGMIMLAGLVFFYILFLLFLYRRAIAMSGRVAAPLGEIAALIGRIGQGEYRQQFAGSQVAELDDLGRELVATGRQLGDAHDRIVEQDHVLGQALARQWQLHEEQVRFIRTMSHELRTPLAAIDSGAQIIDRKAGQLEVDDLRKRASRLRKAVKQISDLLHQLVANAQPDRDFAPAVMQPVALHSLIEETVRSIVPPERLELVLSETDLVLADAMPLTMALRVAVDNAVRYTSGQISVVQELSLDRLTVLVSDNGSGIAEDQLEDVGKRFFRGAESIGTPGAGLGIHLARTVLEAVGGTFKLSSGDGGTTVSITMPIPTPHVADGGPSDDRAKAKILCIEDDPHLREDLVHELREAGYAVCEALDGQSGLDIIRKGGISLVYCDVQLPGMDGFGVLEHLRAWPEPDTRPPVVLLTAYGDGPARQRAADLGARSLLVKPVDYDEVLRLTRQLTGS
ncbi:response regulator [Sphingomonas lacunae]|uniref:histidine kinase n=1 Tax=Sphingomonas lacunae TaxID=2698828 RepID=A0A6M4AW52_9SPHN|nr:response regulator [Sphingomonas lacunae]QJQ32580.1 response regulator [Sphingomonas lacunae]